MRLSDESSFMVWESYKEVRFVPFLDCLVYALFTLWFRFWVKVTRVFQEVFTLGL